MVFDFASSRARYIAYERPPVAISPATEVTARRVAASLSEIAAAGIAGTKSKELGAPLKWCADAPRPRRGRRDARAAAPRPGDAASRTHAASGRAITVSKLDPD